MLCRQRVRVPTGRLRGLRGLRGLPRLRGPPRLRRASPSSPPSPPSPPLPRQADGPARIGSSRRADDAPCRRLPRPRPRPRPPTQPRPRMAQRTRTGRHRRDVLGRAVRPAGPTSTHAIDRALIATAFAGRLSRLQLSVGRGTLPRHARSQARRACIHANVQRGRADGWPWRGLSVTQRQPGPGARRRTDVATVVVVVVFAAYPTALRYIGCA